MGILGIVTCFGASTLGAQNWDETADGGGDAGLQTSAQMTSGSTLLTTISGSIHTAAGDHTDCYGITVQTVAGPTGFYATTDPGIDPNAVVGDSDTRLWIWDSTGTNIISGNDDSPSQAGLLSVVADPTGPIAFVAAPTNPVTTTLIAGNQYILCYSYFSNDPEDASNIDLIDMGTFEALNGPNPAAGAFAAYEDSNNEGPLPYTIALQAVASSDLPLELTAFSID